MFLILLVPLGIVAYFLFFNKNANRIQLPYSKSAEEILNERYANDEIDEETYKIMKARIKD